MTFRSLITLALAASLTACALPGTTSGPTTPASTTTTGAPGRLVFHFQNTSSKAVDYSYTTAAVHFLVVQIHSAATGSTKFASVAFDPAVTPDPAVTFSGLPGGTWDLTASLYDTDGSAAGTAANWDLGSKPSGTTGQPLLLFSARQQIAVQTATGSSVNLLVYRPGDIGSVTVMEPSFVKTVTVADSVAQAGLVHVHAGEAVNVVAQVVDAQGQPATEQRVTWSADDPSVQVIPVPGSAPPMALVKGTKEGSFAVKATSAESVPTNNPDLYGAFALDVEPPVYGTWQGNVGDGTTFLSVYRDTQGRLAFEMVTPGQYFFDLRGLISVDPSGSTWEFLQTQDSTWDSSGIKTWNSVSGEVWDFAATMSPTGAFLEIPTYETSFGSVGQALIPTNQTLSIATPPTFIVGMTQQLHAQWSPDPLVPDVIWTTSDPSIATVDPVSGSVTFLLAGQNVLITAISRLNPALSASVTLGASPLPDPFGAGNGIVTSVVPDNTVQGGWQVAGMTGGTGLFEPRVFTSHRTTLGGQDAGFAGLGYFILPPTPSVWGQNYYGHGSMGIGAVQLPTGGLVVDQYLQNGIGNIGLYRYQPDGSAFAGYAGVASVVPIVRPVVDDGGAVYTVVRGSSPFAVVRLDNKGQVDGTYQANSSQSANSLFNGGFLPWTSAVYPSTDPDGNAGKFLVAGENPGGAFPLVRLLADGTPDTAFNTAVSTLSGLLSVDANVTSLAVTGIRISGSTIAFVVQNTGSTGTFASCLVVLNSDGSLNSDFVSPGQEVTGGIVTLPGTMHAYDLAIAGDGSIVVVGDSLAQNGFALLYKYAASGGTPTGTNVGASNGMSGARAVAIDGSGNVGIGGFTRVNAYNGDNLLDATAHLWVLTPGNY